MNISREYLKNLGISLDLAIEAHNLARGDADKEIPGVKETVKNLKNAKVTTIEIMDEQGANRMGKIPGKYITIEAPSLRENNFEVHQEIANLVREELEILIQSLTINPNDPIFIIGLGNWDATPDALGPKVASKVLVTRHIYKYAPENLHEGLRPVCALAPGVLGITGIETAEIVRGVVEKIAPSLVIAVDALAAMDLSRISATIQIADTGINPGSGIGNLRMGINKETLGVPVLAIGIPTVVHAAVVVSAALHSLAQTQPIQKTMLNESTAQGIIQSVLQPFNGNFTVTPKEIDDLIENNSKIIASGLNQALHPAIGPEEGSIYLH
ncbi:MAG: GPR endopeptidase [Bacillota bacterium]